MKLYKGTNPEMDSYSAFFDNIRSSGSTGITEQCIVDFVSINFRVKERKISHSALVLAGLDVTLAEAGTETVYVSGVATDFCVGYTAVDALSLGLTTFVVDDLIRGVADEGTDT